MLYKLGTKRISMTLFLIVSVISISQLVFSFDKELALILAWVDIALFILLWISLFALLRHKDREIFHHFYHDTHTNLPLRLYFEEAANELFQENPVRKYVILMIRIDQYYILNFTLGTSFITKIMQEIFTRIAKILAKPQIIAQVDHRAFGVIQEYDNPQNVEKLIADIIEVCKLPLKINKIDIDVSVHVGGAIYSEDGTTPEQLIQKAMVARHNAQLGYQEFEMYDSKQDEFDRRRLSLLSDVKKAMVSGELRLFYQPKLNLEKNQVDEVEALIRWEHPEYGFIPPDQFIPILEQSPVMREFTQWILEKAIKQIKIWDSHGLMLKVGVNISTRDIADPKFCDQLNELLHHHDVHPSRMILEITETAVMYNPSLITKHLNQLRKKGIILAIDDFGTGYSTLEYLKMLPIQELKVDKSFIQNMEQNPRNEAIVLGIRQLAENLGIRFVAEGVEDASTLQFLRENKFIRAQGYYIARRLPPKEFEDWLLTSDWFPSKFE